LDCSYREELSVTDFRGNILADIREGRVVSPGRIRRLIDENEVMARTYERFVALGGDAGRESRACAEAVRDESRAFGAMLGSWDSVIDRIEAELSAPVESETRLRLLGLRNEWIAYGASRTVNTYMFAERPTLPQGPKRGLKIGAGTRRLLEEARK
jgi:hypothetical protein